MTIKGEHASDWVYLEVMRPSCADFGIEAFQAGWDAALNWAAKNARANHDDDPEYSVIPESILVGKTIEA